jgi:hypothetical protein
MKVKAHCIAENAAINPEFLIFKFKEFDALLYTMPGIKDKETKELTLELSRVLTMEEQATLTTKISAEDDPSVFFEKRSRPYNEALTEISHLIEGLFSILYAAAPPKFNSNKANVNFYGETEEEVELLRSDKVMRGFGVVTMPTVHPTYQIDDRIQELIEPSSEHLAALSFLANAIRAYYSNDNEIAFFLYFRIIEGYFSDGKSDVEKELLKKEVELKKYITYDQEIIENTRSILNALTLESKSNKNFAGLISDIVLIRHKLTHFSSTHSIKHHNAKIKFELSTLNGYMSFACINILRDQIGAS